MLLGNTILIGILRTPGDVAAQLPGAALFIGVKVSRSVCQRRTPRRRSTLIRDSDGIIAVREDVIALAG